MLQIIIVGLIFYLVISKWTWDEPGKYPSLSYQNLIDKNGLDVNTKIQNINISWINSIWIHINNSNPYLVSQKNTLRIVKMVVDNEWKTYFEPNELKGIYNFIIENYKSSLPIKEYEKISNLFKEFVEQGWEIKINYSSQKSSWIWLFFKIIGFLLLIPIIWVAGVFIFCLIIMAF